MAVFSRVVRLAALASCLGLGLFSLGCGEIDGGQEPFAGTSLYQEQNGLYQLRLLVPPWFPLALPTGTIFVVPPDGIISINSKETDALYSLHVIQVDGDAASAMAATAALYDPPWDLSRMRPVRALSGASGAELSWQEAAGIYHREAFLGAATAPTFQLHFTARRELANDDMVSQMILSFAPKGLGSGVVH